MASGIFAVANIGSVRLYVGEVHLLKPRWAEILVQLEKGTFADSVVQDAWRAANGDRRFSFHTAQDLDNDQTMRGRARFRKDCLKS
ncbi:MAG: hypothetical protein AAGE59_06660 [Cyanobacteria bacterium P01_F01_bin.86]